MTPEDYDALLREYIVLSDAIGRMLKGIRALNLPHERESLEPMLADLIAAYVRAEADNDTLRVTLAATRAELDRALTLAVEDRHKMAELERDIAIYEDNTDQSCP